MKKSKRFLSLLLAVVMAMSLLLMTGMADNSAAVATQSDAKSSEDNLVMSKVYDPDTGMLTLEAYATGESQTQTVTKPVDIALVLDVSGSMENKKLRTGTGAWEKAYHFGDGKNIFGVQTGTNYRETYIKVGNRNDLSELDTVYGANTDGEHPIYFLHSVNFVADGLTKMRYTGTEWQYYGWTATWGGGKWEWKSVDKSSFASGNVYISKLDALKLAVSKFIDAAAEKSGNNPDDPCRISVIKFAGDKNTSVGNDTYEHSNTDTGWANYSQVVLGMTDLSGSGVQTVTDSVKALLASGATRADYGMQLAQTVLYPENDQHSDHKKVVLMFTDGEPTSTSNFENSVANGAITASGAMKNKGATVYTVGCFANTPSTETQNYMDYVSSNYPSATSMEAPGTSASTKYYKTTDNSTELTGIFETINQEIGGTKVTLKSDAVLKDVVSEYFDLPENAVASDIKVHTESAQFSNGVLTGWTNDNNENNPYKAEIGADRKTITVTGFDYSAAANWVGSHGGNYHGKKIVVQIPIVDNKTGYGTVPTNTDASGIYKSANGDMVKAFVSPTVYFPYYQVAHVQGSAVVKTDKYRVEPNSENVTLTDKVTDQDNYLYGGGFLDQNCTMPSQNGKTGFTTPGEGETYYIREVSNKYLRPSDYDVWQHTGKNAEVHVTHMYMLAPVDCLNYQSVGFLVERNGVTTVTRSQSNGADIAYGVVNAMQSGSLYDQVYVKDGVLRSSKTEVTDRDAGYISMSELEDANFFNNAGATVTFLPYWVTLDGVMVTGTTQSTCTNLGIGTTDKYKWLGYSEDSAKLTADANVTYAPAMKMLSFCKAAAFETDPAVLEAQTVTITVNDNGSVTTVNLDKGDLTGKLTPAGADGKVFAGWYTDEACTVPADFSDVQSDMTVYAKYVSGAYLSVKYKQVGVFRVRSVTLLSAVDSKDYQDSGYIINGEQVSCTNYKNRYGIITARMIFGRDVSRSAQLMTYSYATTGLTKGDTIEIVPYWVTLDGTLVTGTARTLTYNVRGLNG